MQTSPQTKSPILCVVQCIAVHCSALQCIAGRMKRTARLCVAVCSSMMQFVAVYCRESTSLFSTSRINKSHDRLHWLFCGMRPATILCIFVVIKRRRISGSHLQSLCTWVTDWCRWEDTGSLHILLPKKKNLLKSSNVPHNSNCTPNTSFYSNPNELWGNREISIVPNGRGDMIVARCWVVGEVA